MELFIMFWGFIILYNININREDKENKFIAKSYFIAAIICFMVYVLQLIKGV